MIRVGVSGANGQMGKLVAAGIQRSADAELAGLYDPAGAGEQVAGWARGGRVVKAFNTAGSGTMADPAFGPEAVTMFICGDDDAAKTKVAKLAEEMGFEVADTGPLVTSRYLEPLAMLWIQLAYGQGWGTEFAFRITKR